MVSDNTPNIFWRWLQICQTVFSCAYLTELFQAIKKEMLIIFYQFTY